MHKLANMFCDHKIEYVLFDKMKRWIRIYNLTMIETVAIQKFPWFNEIQFWLQF